MLPWKVLKKRFSVLSDFNVIAEERTQIIYIIIKHKPTVNRSDFQTKTILYYYYNIFSLIMDLIKIQLIIHLHKNENYRDIFKNIKLNINIFIYSNIKNQVTLWLSTFYAYILTLGCVYSVYWRQQKTILIIFFFSTVCWLHRNQASVSEV